MGAVNLPFLKLMLCHRGLSPGGGLLAGIKFYFEMRQICSLFPSFPPPPAPRKGFILRMIFDRFDCEENVKRAGVIMRGREGELTV